MVYPYGSGGNHDEESPIPVEQKKKYAPEHIFSIFSVWMATLKVEEALPQRLMNQALRRAMWARAFERIKTGTNEKAARMLRLYLIQMLEDLHLAIACLS